MSSLFEAAELFSEAGNRQIITTLSTAVAGVGEVFGISMQAPQSVGWLVGL